MGKWRNRRSRRFFYHQYKDPASSYYDPEEPPLPIPVFAEDGVPSWEKKFCSLIGSVPWQKVVNVKKVMYCHHIVVNWDDSAGKEAFQNAKKRFWEQINCLPCGISLPDPDMYIDDINWNPDIDPELLEDLGKAFFAPEEGEQDCKLECANKTTVNFVSVPADGWNRNPGEVRTPWECNNNMQSGIALKDEAQCWNQGEFLTNDLRNLNNADNAWNHCSAQANETVKSSTWRDSGNKSRGWHYNGIYVNQSKDWDNSNSNNDDNPWEWRYPQGTEAMKGDTWEEHSDKLRGWSHCKNQVNQSKDWDDDDNAWEPNRQNVGIVKDNVWDSFNHNSWSNNQQKPGNSWENNFNWGCESSKDRQWRGWKRWDNNYGEPKDMEYRQAGGGWGTWNDGHRKREGSHQYITGNKHTRFQGNDYQTGRHWRGGATNKRVSFAFE